MHANRFSKEGNVNFSEDEDTSLIGTVNSNQLSSEDEDPSLFELLNANWLSEEFTGTVSAIQFTEEEDTSSIGTWVQIDFLRKDIS